MLSSSILQQTRSESLRQRREKCLARRPRRKAKFSRGRNMTRPIRPAWWGRQHDALQEKRILHPNSRSWSRTPLVVAATSGRACRIRQRWPSLHGSQSRVQRVLSAATRASPSVAPSKEATFTLIMGSHPGRRQCASQSRRFCRASVMSGLALHGRRRDECWGWSMRAWRRQPQPRLGRCCNLTNHFAVAAARRESLEPPNRGDFSADEVLSLVIVGRASCPLGMGA